MTTVVNAHANDNRERDARGRPLAFPQDAVARIYRPSPSVMTSAKPRKRGWRLVFERRTAPFIEPLMGYTGGDDMLIQIALSFPTLGAAIRYAERQGLTYVVDEPADPDARVPHGYRARSPLEGAGAKPAFSNATLDRLGLAGVRDAYSKAMDGTSGRQDPTGPENWKNPMDVVHDRSLTLEAKRSILMNWAWTEFQIDQATNEGMPENRRPARLGEVEQALLALEREAATNRKEVCTAKAA